MAPRSVKRKFRARHPIPVWLPLPRPCIGSLNMPGHPYYMPIPPEMYLPPWTIPPSYFTKPLCHCANENFCTATNCRNSAECLKMHPMFCPHGTENEENTDSQQNVMEQQHDGDDEETSSNSDINICSACGAPSSKLRKSGKKKYFQDNQPKPDHTSRVTKIQNSSHNVKKRKQGVGGIDVERNNVSIANRNVPSRETVHRTESGNSSPEITPSKKQNDCVHSSCQTASSNSRARGNNRLTQKKYNINSPNKDKRYIDSTTDLEDFRSSVLETDRAANNFTKNEFGCSSCTGQNSGPANGLEMYNPNLMSVDERELAKTNKLTTDSLHIQQLPDNLSSARKKYSRCCFPGAENSCKIDVEMDTMETSYKNKSRKKLECECYSNKTPGKTKSKSHKLSDCICSASSTQHESPKFLKKLNCECSPNKISQKTKHRKVSECSCPYSDVPNLTKDTSKSRKISKNCTEGCIPKTSSSKLGTVKSKKSLSDTTSLRKTNARQSSCQCKFPPAYEHLSCTGNESNNCSCANNT